MSRNFKKLSLKQKRLFVEQADHGFHNLDSNDFKGTELHVIISEWQEFNNQLENIFENLSEELDQ